MTTTPVEPSLITSFKAWLRRHRGASDATIRLYARDVARLLMALGDDPATWDAAAVRTTFMDLASTSGRGTIEKMTTSLRAFLRYLAVEGRCRAGLDSAVPAYAHWRLADMPRYLATEQVNCLIAACNGQAPARRRDRAIILLLVRLGLRAGDVAQLRLDDIEWETGSLRVAGKSRIEVRLPLPQWKTTAAALRAWLAVRVRAAAPEVFVNARGEPLTRWGFAYLLKQHVATAARHKPGLKKKRVSPHVLRHTCAMIVLQATGDIRKVSLWLGHATLTTTEVYTRGDPTEKLDAMEAIVPPHLRRGTFQPSDKLLALLKRTS